MSYNNNNNHNYNNHRDRDRDRDRDGGGMRNRIRGLRRNNRPEITQEEYNEKFDYASNPEHNLFDQDDIVVSPEALADEKKEFHEIGGDDGLKENLLRGIYSFGFEKPSRIQGLAIEQMIKGREILAQSHSGTGKTGAFVISAFQLLDENLKKPQIILLSPTHELAQQTFSVCLGLGSNIPGINYSFTVGGTDRQNNLKEIGFNNPNAAQIIVATPGRLVDLISSNKNLFESIKLLVVDECDELMAGTFQNELKIIIKGLPQNIQICLFSATLTTDVVGIAEKILKNPIKILIKKEKMTLDGIIQSYVEIQREDQKLEVLKDMLKSIPIQQFIVYVNSKSKSEYLRHELEKEYAVMLINGSQSKYERAETIRKFKKGGAKCLISTDLLSRGIDIQQLSLVINYEMPQSDRIQCYIHRIGRTGRFNKNGLAINLVTRYEQELQNRIAVTFKCSIKPLKEDFLKHLA